jgi:hypothetical protein
MKSSLFLNPFFRLNKESELRGTGGKSEAREANEGRGEVVMEADEGILSA